MLLDAMLAFFHYVAIFLTVAFLAIDMALCRAPLNAATAMRLSRTDLIYFIAAMLALVSGVLRVAYGAKGWAFYLYNPVFYAKIGTFALIGILSVPPTLRFLRWAKIAKVDASYVVPEAEVAVARRFIHAELALLLVLPLLAVLMARGFGA